MLLNKFAFVVPAILLAASCSMLSKDSESDHLIINLVDFKPTNKLFLLGDSTKVRLTYSFSLGEHEVTQKEFKSILGFNPNENSSLEQELAPVTFVSFFDAILFCNKASADAGLDSVYSYTAATIGNATQSSVIEGLSADYSKNGYRLPTEAEWVFAAKQNQNFTYPWGNTLDSADQYAWHEANAAGATHEVCTLSKTQSLCDLAGNAMEWVDGWYNILPKDSVVNFIGSANPSALEERIVKGGGFRSNKGKLNNNNRIDVYGTYSTTRTEYLGFRVAKGAIPNPTYNDNGSISTNPSQAIKIMASRNEVESFFGTSKVRLVMTNGSDLSARTIDFNSQNIVVQNPGIPAPVLLPTISPNGQYFAFTSRIEGQKGSSSIYTSAFNPLSQASPVAHANAAIPRWYINPDHSNDTVLVWSENAEGNRDSASWSSRKTYASHFSNGSIGTDSILWETGVFNDGISDDGRFWISSFPVLRALDKSTGKVSTYFLSPENGKTSSGSTQVCNASMRRGANPSIMFLDFGSDAKSSITNSSYGVHEVLFWMDPSTGKIQDYLFKPESYNGWNYPEWSNHPNFAVATVTDSDDQSKAVYAIRFSDKAVLKLAEGSNILNPALWVGLLDGSSIEVPSKMFRYDIPLTLFSYEFATKMMLYWNIKNDMDLVVMGSSRTHSGVDPSVFSDYHGYNLAMSGEDPWTYFHLWDDYLQSHSTNIKMVIVELSLDFLYYLSNERWEPMWASTDGYQYDKSQGFYKEGFPAAFDTLRQLANPTVFHVDNPRGFMAAPSGGWGGSDPVVAPWKEMVAHPESWRTTLDTVERWISRLNAKGINVLGIIPPQNPAFVKNKNSWGCYGPNLVTAQEILDSLATMDKRLTHFRLFNQHLMGNHDYADAEAENNNHLSAAGAAKLTARIDSVLKAW